MQASIHLRKDKVNKSGLIPLQLIITFYGKRIRKSIPSVKVLETDWKIKDERIKPSKTNATYNFHVEFNKILDDTSDDIKKLFRYIHLNNINPTKEFILEKLEKGIDTIHLYHEFNACFDEFIESNKSTKTPRTIKSYVTTQNFLKDFDSSTGYGITFDNIDNLFFDRIQDYTFLDRENKNSYLAFIIKVLKTFLNWAHEREYHNNFKYKKFKAKEDPTEVIYLTQDELKTLNDHKFESKRLEHVKDTFCFGCYTSLRISDLKQLSSSHIFEDYIKINIQKTKTKDHITPLNSQAKKILQKYKNTIYEPLPIISEQKYNKYIKECCKEVGINTPTTITRYCGQKRIDKTLPKYKLISSHTARKTFITNSLILGMKEIVLRSITGHKKEESFRKYVNISEDFKQQEMKNTWG